MTDPHHARRLDLKKFQADLAATAIAAKAIVELYDLSRDRDRLVTGLKEAHTDAPTTPYRLTAYIACNLAWRCVIDVVETIPAGSTAQLSIVDDHGNKVDPEMVGSKSPCFVARMRMLSAMLNRDVPAALDVFCAFEVTNPDDVADLVADLVEQAHATIANCSDKSHGH